MKTRETKLSHRSYSIHGLFYQYIMNWRDVQVIIPRRFKVVTTRTHTADWIERIRNVIVNWFPDTTNFASVESSPMTYLINNSHHDAGGTVRHDRKDLIPCGNFLYLPRSRRSSPWSRGSRHQGLLIQIYSRPIWRYTRRRHGLMIPACSCI